MSTKANFWACSDNVDANRTINNNTFFIIIRYYVFSLSRYLVITLSRYDDTL